MASPGARGPYAKSAARRAEILRAARESFAERGYARSSVRDIADRAGITHAGLLHHFAGKDELLLAVLQQRDAEEAERSQVEVPDPAGDPGSVTTFLGTLLCEHQQAPELMRLWAELAVASSRPEHPAHAHFVDRYERARSWMAEHFRSLAASGDVREDVDVDAAAALLVAVLDGLQTQWLLDSRVDIVAALSQFLDLLQPPAEKRV